MKNPPRHSPRQSAQKRRQIAWRRCLSLDSLGRVPVDPSKLNHGNSYSRPRFAEDGYYTDFPFICKDCGTSCVWKASDQKWWYEEIRGFSGATAVRCRVCRIKERERKAEARRVSAEGKRRKRLRQAGATAIPELEDIRLQRIMQP